MYNVNNGYIIRYKCRDKWHVSIIFLFIYNEINVIYIYETCFLCIFRCSV